MKSTLTRLAVLPIAALALVLLLVACSETLRLHDEGRLKTTEEAVKIAAELSAGSDPVFDPMLENLEAIGKVQPKLRARDDQSFMASFEEDFPRLTAEQVGQHLFLAIAQRIVTFDQNDKAVARAATRVNETLDRQEKITLFLKDAAKKKSDVEEALTRVKKRIAWIEGRLKQVEQVRSKLGKAGSASKKLAEALKKATDKEKVEAALKHAKDVIDGIEQDEQLTDAKKLLKEFADEIAASEKDRLEEMRRHLSEVKRIRKMIRDRDRIAVCSLYLRAVETVYPGIKNSALQVKSFLPANLLARLDNALARALGKALAPGQTVVGNKALDQAFTVANAHLILSGRYDGYRETFGEQDPCFERLDPDPGKWLPAKDIKDIRALWTAGGKPATLAEFVAADIGALGVEADGPVLVATLGILVQHEYQALRDALVILARELHKHSILLSKLNAQQRAGLVHQLSQGLNIYYQGGIKPEEMAELLLLAGQVGALSIIGAKQ